MPLLNDNFRLTGDAYQSKKGSDGDSGLDPLNPKASLTAGLSVIGANDVLICGAGQNTESVTITNKNIEADGRVFLDGLSVNTLSLNMTASHYIRNFEVRNYIINHVSLNRPEFQECVVENNTINILIAAAGVKYTQGTILRGNTWNIAAGAFIYADGAVFLDGVITEMFSCENTFFGENAVVFRGPAPFIFDYNCIDGLVAIPLDGAVSGAAVNNVPLAFSTTSPAWDSVSPVFVDEYPALVLNNYTSEGNTFFNGLDIGDYTVSPASKLIYRGSVVGQNIGKVKVAELYRANAEFPVSNQTGLTGTTDMTLTGAVGNVFCTVRGNGTLQRLGVCNYSGLRQENSDDGVNTANNNNVPDFNDSPVIPGQDNPDRDGVRFSFTTGVDTNQATWTNGGLTAAGEFVNMELGRMLNIDSNGKGTGSADFAVGASVFPVTATYWIYDVVLIEGKL